MEDEKTVDIIVQEYEQKLQDLEETKNKEIANLKEEHAQEIRAIISGRQNPQIEKPTEDEEEEDFFTKNLKQTRKNLKLE